MKSKPALLSPTFSAPEQFELLHVKPKAGRTLIVGSYVTEGKQDRRARYADVVGVDMRPGPGVDIVLDLEECHYLSDELTDLGVFDHVECMSVLEHSRRPWLLAENLELLMALDATFHFSVPFIWRVHNYPSDYWRMTTDAVRLIFQNIEWKTLVYGDIEFREAGKVPAAKQDGHLYIAQSQVFGFGVRL